MRLRNKKLYSPLLLTNNPRSSLSHCHGGLGLYPIMDCIAEIGAYQDRQLCFIFCSSSLVSNDAKVASQVVLTSRAWQHTCIIFWVGFNPSSELHMFSNECDTWRKTPLQYLGTRCKEHSQQRTVTWQESVHGRVPLGGVRADATVMQVAETRHW